MTHVLTCENLEDHLLFVSMNDEALQGVFSRGLKEHLKDEVAA